MKTPRVLHICNGFRKELFRKLFTTLKLFDIYQFVYYPKRNWMQNPDFKKLGIEGYTYSKHNLIFQLFYFYKIKVYKNELMKYFDKNDIEINSFDLIHAHNLFADGGIGYLLNKKYNIPYIAAIRSSDLFYLKYMPFLKPFGKKILERSKSIICITPILKKQILKKYSNIPGLESKIKVIPNGISDEFFKTPVIKKNQKNNQTINLNYIGDFSKNKNVHKLIRFAAEFPKKYFLKIIGGGGNYKKKVLQLIKNSPNVEYLGKIKNKIEIISELKESDIFIMASSTETFGIVYPEAMSQGLPIIYSKNTGFDGFFEEGKVGFGIEAKNFKDLDKKIALIMNNYEEISKTCIEESKQFNWNKIASQYSKIYNDIIQFK